MNDIDVIDAIDDINDINGMDDICTICLDDNVNIKGKCKTQCNHIFCKECLEEVFKKGIICPMCRGDITSYSCNNFDTRILYIEKKRIRNIQTIVEQRNHMSINNNCKLLTISFLLTCNAIMGILLVNC